MPDEELPLVSVVVPVFNEEPFIRESLDSILAQSYPRLETIVIDDASTDRTPEIVAEYGGSVRLVRQPETKGIYASANAGVALAAGDLIAIFHGDDVYDAQIVEREVEVLGDYPEAGAVFCKDVFIDANGAEFGRLELPPEFAGGGLYVYPDLLNGLLRYKNRFLRCPGAIVRADVYRECGTYRTELGIAADLDMWLRIARRRPVAILDEYLFRYRQGHGSSSDDYFHLRTEPERFFDILDEALAVSGNELAARDAVVAFRAHRAEDGLMVALNLYVQGRRADARAALRGLRLRSLLGSPRVQRGRLTVLLLAARVLVRLPTLPVVARLLYRRWHFPRAAPAR